MKLLLYVIAWWSLGCGGGKDASGSTEAGGDKPKVLARLDGFKQAGNETYDSVKKSLDLIAAAKKAGTEPPSWTRSAYELPPTPADTLASDIRMLAFYDLAKPKLDAKTITAEPVKQVLEIYSKAPASELRGLRPTTHQAFVKSLSDADRAALADELVDYIKANGFKGADKIENDPVPAQPSAAAKLVLGGSGAAKPTDSSPPAAGNVPVYAGKYRTTEGAMTLFQRKANPAQVDGIYAKGQIACNATGAHLDCAWIEGSVKGRAQFDRDAAGNLKGTWGKGKADRGGGAWSCTLVAAGVIE